MSDSPFEIAFLLDANITTDMLDQIETLASRLSDNAQFRPRFVVFGSINSDCAVSRRYENLHSCRDSAARPVELHHLPLRHSIHPFDTLTFSRSRALAGCNLIHCFSLSLLDVLLGLPAGQALPPFLLTLASWPGQRIVRRLARRAASFAGIICFTDDLRDGLIAAGVPAQLCTSIAPWLSLQPTPGKSAARSRLDLPEGVELVLADSHMSVCSHQRLLSWAVAVVAQFRPHVRVVFPGCDPKVDRVKQFDNTLTPPSLGIYSAERYEPDSLYAAADLLVLPATGPVSPLPLFRAARAHLPVVASDSPYFRRHLSHRHNALLFSPDNYTPGDRSRRRIRPLVAAIAQLFDEPDLARRLADRLAQDINSSFPPGASLDAHLALYQNILSSRRLASEPTA